MMPRQLKIMGYFILIILVLNLLLFAFRIISGLVFWGVIVVGAALVYWVLPRMKKE